MFITPNNFNLILFLLTIVSPLLWHIFCIKLANRTQAESVPAHFPKLLVLLLVTIPVQIAYNYTGKVRLGNCFLNCLSLLIDFLYATHFFKLDKRITTCCLVLISICEGVFEYIYTFLVLIVFQLATPESIVELPWLTIIYQFSGNVAIGILMFVLSHLTYNCLEAMKEKCIFQLFLAVLITDYFIFLSFSLLLPEKYDQIFNRGTFVTILSEISFVCITIFMMLSFAKRQRKMEESFTCALTKIELLEQVQENSEKTKKLLHDTKNHFANIEYLLKYNLFENAQDYVKQLVPQLEDICTFEKGETILSVLLYRKKAEAKHLGVEMDYIVNVKAVRLPIVDVSMIVCNMCDNAIEYCSKHGLGASGVQYRVFVMDNELVFECYNKILEETVPNKEGKFVTTKKDKEYHGYGLSILTDCAQKYGGEVYIQQESSLFIIQIRLPICYAVEKEGEKAFT